MPNVEHATDTPAGTPRTQEELLLAGLTAYRDAVDRYRDLTKPQRLAVLTATADLIADLRAARVIA
jgi:hypothetical protein